MPRKTIKQNLRLGSYIVIVVGLCLFGSWLTFIFGTKMANITLNTFNLQQEVSYDNSIVSNKRQYTHGSLVSHLSLDALHREQDRVYLRRLDFESEEALALLFPSFVV